MHKQTTQLCYGTGTYDTGLLWRWNLRHRSAMALELTTQVCYGAEINDAGL